MNSSEKAEMLASLESGRQALINTLSEVTEDLARRSPGPGKWSVLECTEHLAVAEAYLLAQVEGSTRAESPVVNRARERAIVERGADRTKRVEAPDAAKPTGRFATLQEALDHFSASRTRTLQFVENANEDLRARFCHHPLIGTVNCYENLLIMAMHPHRHTKQIQEILEAVNR